MEANLYSNQANIYLNTLKDIKQMIVETEIEIIELKNTVNYCQFMGGEPSETIKKNLAEAEHLHSLYIERWNATVKESIL